MNAPPRKRPSFNPRLRRESPREYLRGGAGIPAVTERVMRTHLERWVQHAPWGAGVRITRSVAECCVFGCQRTSGALVDGQGVPGVEFAVRPGAALEVRGGEFGFGGAAEDGTQVLVEQVEELSSGGFRDRDEAVGEE